MPDSRGLRSDTPTARRRSPTASQDTGLSAEFLMDLLLRTLYVQGARTGVALTETLRLPFTLLDDFLLTLQTRRLLELRGTTGHGRSAYVFDLTNQGRNRARETMQTVAYVGPAPVPLAQYRDWCERQSIRNAQVSRETVKEGLSWLVLDPAAARPAGARGQLGQVGVPARRVGQRQDRHRRDDGPDGGRLHVHPLRGRGRRRGAGPVRSGAPPPGREGRGRRRSQPARSSARPATTTGATCTSSGRWCWSAAS